MKSRGYAALSAGSTLVSHEFDRRVLGAHDVALDISYSGICHSDIHQVAEEWGPAISWPGTIGKIAGPHSPATW